MKILTILEKSNRKSVDYVDVCFYEDIVPGLWIIPLQNNTCRVDCFPIIPTDSKHNYNRLRMKILNMK